jgi:hypothetical protein
VNCLDAETLAAWFDGGLSGAALEDVRSHVATCARCQALVGAMGRTRRPFRRHSLSGIRDGGSHGRSRRRQLQQPLLSGSQSLIRRTSRSILRLRLRCRSRRRRLRARYHPRQHRPSPPRRPPLLQHPRGRPAQRLTPPLRRRHRRLQTTPCSRRLLRSTKPFQYGPPPAPPAAAERRDEAERQGAAAGQLQARAAFANNLCGPMWPAPPSEVAAQVTAGSSPSTAVCWIVGRAGTVLRSTDQRTWQRLTFPLTADLTSVTATDAQSASVVTADGRTFSTVDGGVTWIQR